MILRIERHAVWRQNGQRRRSASSASRCLTEILKCRSSAAISSGGSGTSRTWWRRRFKVRMATMPRSPNPAISAPDRPLPPGPPPARAWPAQSSSESRPVHLVFQASSSGSVCGGLQLRGATEWDEPEHLFSSGIVSVADRAPRTDQQLAPPSGPSPVGSHLVSRGGRAPFDRGDPLRAVMPKSDPGAWGAQNKSGHGRMASDQNRSSAPNTSLRRCRYLAGALGTGWTTSPARLRRRQRLLVPALPSRRRAAWRCDPPATLRTCRSS
jgi:hypothetical protein